MRRGIYACEAVTGDPRNVVMCGEPALLYRDPDFRANIWYCPTHAHGRCISWWPLCECMTGDTVRELRACGRVANVSIGSAVADSVQCCEEHALTFGWEPYVEPTPDRSAGPRNRRWQ